MAKCDMCKKDKEDVELQPARSTLTFGMRYGRIKYERRCRACEEKLVKQIEKTLANIRKAP